MLEILGFNGRNENARLEIKYLNVNWAPGRIGGDLEIMVSVEVPDFFGKTGAIVIYDTMLEFMQGSVKICGGTETVAEITDWEGLVITMQLLTSGKTVAIMVELDRMVSWDRNLDEIGDKYMGGHSPARLDCCFWADPLAVSKALKKGISELGSLRSKE